MSQRSQGAPSGSSRPWFKKKQWWAVGAVLVIVIALALGWGLRGSDDETPSTADSSEQQASEEPTPGSEQEETDSQNNARRTAEQYLENHAPFSRSGLIKQLEMEDHSTKDATYAVDKADADWNEQAAKAAGIYREKSDISRADLIQVLEFDGYTEEQIEYGVKKAGL